MKTALKEWAVIVEAIKQGKHHFLLRKGGLADKGQTFKVEHSKFLFFPTYEHQDREMVQPKHVSFYERAVRLSPNLKDLMIDSYGEVKEIYRVKDLESLKLLSKYCIWSEAYFEMRLNYRPEKPLYILFLNVYRLQNAQKIENLRKYGGCRSWIELETDIDTSSSILLPSVTLPESVTKKLQIV